MKKIFVTSVLTILTSFLVHGQEILEKKYYKKIDLKSETTEKKANYVQVKIQENDSIVVFELRDLKSNELIESKKYCNYLPYGKWLYYDESTKDNYEVTYNNTDTTGLIKYNIQNKTLDGEEIKNFENPIFPNLENSLPMYIMRNMKYPKDAFDKGITGKVLTQFVLNENGEILDFSILGRPQPELDREATRVILSSPKWTPAKIDGNPISVYIQYSFSFNLNINGSQSGRRQ